MNDPYMGTVPYTDPGPTWRDLYREHIGSTHTLDPLPQDRKGRDEI